MIELESLDDRESGQAMPLAAVGLFVMTLGVLATLNLGQAVYQKIQLQNTADSAAYSLAAMEARTFNYIAFLNRAQIAHYNTAMVVQSYMTWVGFQVAIQGTAVDLLESLDNGIQTGQKLPKPYSVPYDIEHALVMGFLTYLKTMRDLSVQMLDAMEEVGHGLIEAMTIFNKDVVWMCQLGRALTLNLHLASAMMAFVGRNDPDVRFGSGGAGGIFNLAANAALNSLEYYQSFNSGPGVNPQFIKFLTDYQRTTPQGAYSKVSDDGAEDSYRVMTEIVHATRTPRFVSNRGSSGGEYAVGYAMPGVIVNGDKYGQTKFTEDGEVESNSAKIRAIGEEGNYALGRHLSSDDYAGNARGFATLLPETIMYNDSRSALGDAIDAYESNGAHYRYKGPSSTSKAGYLSPSKSDTVVDLAFPPKNPMHAATAGLADDESGTGGTGGGMGGTSNHAPWKGYAPFFMFKASSDRTADFGQPSTWMILNKSHKEFQTDSHKQPWHMEFEWENGEQKASLDTTIGGRHSSQGDAPNPFKAIHKVIKIFEGLNVISRGMAYYHRPGEGNWKEHPNFFNPFWGARLAPVGQKLQAFWDRFVNQKISTSSDSAVVQGLVSVLKGAEMDLFTSFVTTLVTH